MTAKQLAAVRAHYARTEMGLYRFITTCLEGVRGEMAKVAAESVLVGAIDAGYSEDDTRISVEIVAAVDSMERHEAGLDDEPTTVDGEVVAVEASR